MAGNHLFFDDNLEVLRRGARCTSGWLLIAAIGCLLVSGCGRASEQPAFVFRGVQIGTLCASVKKAGVVKACPADPEPTDTLSYDAPRRECPIDYDEGGACYLTEEKVAGVDPAQAVATFENNKFTGINVIYYKSSFEEVRENLESAYGDPCHSETEPVQNPFGAEFTNERVVWCFKEGELLLIRFDPDLTKSRLGFVMDKPEVARPSVTPNDI